MSSKSKGTSRKNARKPSKSTKIPSIELKDMKLNRVVMEFRYSGGYLFWDKCGECILELKEKLKEPIDFHEHRGGEECVLKFEAIPTAIATFGFKRVSLSCMRLKNINFLRENAPVVLHTITDKLRITQIERVGLRYWYVKKMESKDDAENLVNNLNLSSYDPVRFKGFGEKIVSDSPKALVVSDDFKVTIRIAPGHAENVALEELGYKDEYSPEHCLLADFDFYKENVNPEDFDIDEFIHRSHKIIRDNISNLLNS